MQDRVVEEDFAGVIEKLSSGLASGGDIRFDIDGNDISGVLGERRCNCDDEQGRWSVIVGRSEGGGM